VSSAVSDPGRRPRRAAWGAGQWALLGGIVAIFTRPLFGTGLLPGNEATVFEALDRVILRSLAVYGRFPLWNPYLRSGMPVIGDPMLHFADPLVFLPVVLLDVTLGFRVALALSFLAAAIGMWCLAAVLEIRGPVRFWMAVVYAFCGPAVARFYQGQYLFVFGFAWIPWVLAAVLRLAEKRRLRDAGAAAVALGLLFLAGNVYYAFFAIPAIVLLFAAKGGVRPRRGFPYVVLDGKLAALFAAAILLFLLLISPQLLPMLQVRPRLVKAVNLGMTDSHSMPQIARDLLSRSTDRSDAGVLTPEEYYAYIGAVPVALLSLLPLAWRAHRRSAAAFLALLLYAVAWIDMAQTPWRFIYPSIAWLRQFRYPTRMLMYAVVAILVLGGLGADAVWRRLSSAARDRTGKGRLAAVAGLLLLIAALGLSGFEVFRVNRRFVVLDNPIAGREEPLASLRRFDRGEFYCGTNAEYQPVIALGLHDLWAWYHWDFSKPPGDPEFRRQVEPRPEYVVRGVAEGPPSWAEPAFAEPVEVVRGPVYAVYRFPHALPYAFTVAAGVLGGTSEAELLRDDVTPVAAVYRDADTVEIAAEGREAGWLVLAIAHYPGWTVSVDGKPAVLRDADGYLGASLLPGRHRYVFRYRPVLFPAGLVLGALGTVGIAWACGRGGRAVA
jgi:hypothetical protein